MIREIIEKLFKNGVYMALKLAEESKPSFYQYIKENIPGVKQTPDPHLTLIYSKKVFDGDIDIKDYSVEGEVKSFSIFGQDDERALVAEIESDEIIKRNKFLVEKYGFISDFDEYKPHITLAYDIPEDFDVESLPKYVDKMVFDREYINDLVLDWSKKSK